MRIAPLVIGVIVLSFVYAAGAPRAAAEEVIEVLCGDSIQAAIDAAPAGATIRVAPGKFTEHLTLRDEITVRGSADPSSPTVVIAPSLYPVITVLGGARVVLEDFQVEATQRFEIDAVAVYGTADAALRRLEVRGSRGNGIGIHSTGTVEIAGCTIHSNGQFAVLVQTSGATVFGGDNDLRGNGAELGRYAPACLRTPLVAETEAMHVRVPTDYATIQTAIDAVASEGTIEIVAGTYVEALTIWKPVTLVGGEVPAEIAACDEALYGAVVLHEAGAVAVERLRLAGSWTACGCTIALRNTEIDAPEGAGLELEGAATATLHEVSVTSATGSGVRVTGTAHASLDACRFAGCRDGIVVDERGHVDAVACTIASSRLAGASVASAEGSATFHECGFLGNAEGLSSAGTTTLDHCAFDAQLCAIRVANGETRMIGCAVRGSRETGLYAFGGTAHASDCVFAETEGAGAVYCDEDGRVEMAGCTLAENLGHGVYAQQDARVTLTGCTIADNGLSDTEWADAAGILLSDAAIVRLDGCSIGRNAGCGIEVRPLSPLWRIDPSIPEGAPPDCELHMTDCRIFENAGDGLWVTSARSIEIEGTVFERNGGYGIVVDEEFGGRLQLMGCRILENLECGITIGGAKEATLEGCTVAGNAQIGVLVAGSADATIRRCLVQGNLIGVALAQSPHVDLTGCEIRGNLGYGLQVYCLECSGGRQYHSASLDFVGELTGGGNVIPDGSGLDGNGMGGICPAEGWELLLVGGGETSDV